MKINDLKKIDIAPAEGQMLAYTRKQVLFKPYSSIEDVKTAIGDGGLLELHLFDDNAEYRAVVTESARFDTGIIEYIADFELEEGSATHRITGDVYREDCVLENGMGELTVLNHISYDENGMIMVDDYRLKMGGRQNG